MFTTLAKGKSQQGEGKVKMLITIVGSELALRQIDLQITA